MTTPRRIMVPAAAWLLPAYLSACFHYVPAETLPLPERNTDVRLTLAEPLDITMGEFTLNDVTRIEGTVDIADGDTLGLVARWLYPRLGRKYDALYGSYTIPVSEIEQLERWRFDTKRTVLFLGASAAITTFVLHAVWRVVRGGGPGEVDPPPASVVAPR